MTTITKTSAALLAASMLAAPGASAATTVYTDATAFANAVGEPFDAFIDWETGFTNGQSVDGATISGATFRTVSSNRAEIENRADSIGGSFPKGEFALEAREDGDGVSIAIEFDRAITYFGVIYIDVTGISFNGNAFGRTDGSGDSGLFAGLIFDAADDVRRIEVSNVSGTFGFGLDDIGFGTTAAPVPLPAGLPLLLSGGALLGALRLRRRR